MSNATVQPMIWQTRFVAFHQHSRLQHPRRPARMGLIVLLIGACCLYLSTLDNGLRAGELAGGDLITHQYAQVQARPSNAPGYPLYTLGGWLWFHGGRLLLPQVNPVSLLAGYSTWWALLTLALLYRLLLRLTQHNWPLAWLAAAIYATTYFFWFYAVTTEQYTSAVLHTLLFVWAACRWLEAAPRAGAAVGSPHAADRWLMLIALLTGLALSHMVTVLAIVPPIAWLVLRQQPDLLRRPRFLAQLLVIALLPLLSYIFIYLRGAQHPEWRGSGVWLSTWDWFWHFISTGQGRSELTWSLTPPWTVEWPALLWRELTPLGTLAGLAGWALLGRRLGGLLAGAALIYVAFSFIDRLGNWYQVVMPVYALLALGLGVAADRVWKRATAGAVYSGRWARRVPALLLLALGLLLGSRLLFNFGRADQSDRITDTGLAPGWDLLADAPSAAHILATTAEADALRYLTIIGGVRPDVRPLTSAEARDILITGGRLFTSVEAAPLVAQEVTAQPHWRAVSANLIEVMAAPALAADTPDAQVIGDGLALLSVTARLVEPQRADDWPGWAPSRPLTPSLEVRVTWLAQARPAADWAVSIRAIRQGQALQAGDQLVQFDVRHPVAGLYPTTAWSAGEAITDVFRLPLPSHPRPDAAQIVIYRQLDSGSFENLGSIQIPIEP
ncbi:DUF2723 domain-containing protein [Candidatus Amarolinea dominans]|uniref:protein O-mannosyl-transferase family n=1 Tax=Candidatus Amarolinea dominans TaxID=3140696 RepID=UPI00313558ED|nr:DUF2723 domain-containing protein [Anaerolineae bacterium]